LIAFAGHGVQVEVKDPDEKGKPKSLGFLCPTDAALDDVSYKTGQSKTMLGLAELYEALDKSGAGTRRVLVDGVRGESKRKDLDVEGPRVPRGTAALFSCKGGETAYESDKLGEGHGVFFYHVVQGLKGEAKDKKGSVTWASLADYVSETVSEDVQK